MYPQYKEHRLKMKKKKAEKVDRRTESMNSPVPMVANKNVQKEDDKANNIVSLGHTMPTPQVTIDPDSQKDLVPECEDISDDGRDGSRSEHQPAALDTGNAGDDSDDDDAIFLAASKQFGF